MKEKIRQEFEKKKKSVETQAAIARSTAINQSRLEKIKSRQEVMTRVAGLSKDQLISDMKQEAKKKEFYQKLIVQGLLMLLESEVKVRCRAVDDEIVKVVMSGAEAEYSKIIQKETGATRKCKISLDTEVKLAPPPSGKDQVGASCMGGVVLACQNGTITIDNTIDSRLGLVVDQSKPVIRSLLFPQK